MKKYYIKTFGCQMNESDSERIAAFLEKQGYEPVKGADSSADSAFAAASAKETALAKADLIVVNACSVRQTAIDRIFGLKPKILKSKIRNPKLKTILTGCILKVDKIKFRKFFDEIVDIKNFFISPIFPDRDKKTINYLGIKPKYLYKYSAFVPIMTGCNNFCSYCVVPYTRGREISRPIKEIVDEVKNFVKNSYKEIILLGQNVNSYKYGFPKLLKLINNISGNFTIKFLTSHPKDMSDELIETIAKSKKIAKEIHLPIQSGDDEILKKMNRKYTVKQYKKLVEKIRKKIPDVRITTDVIVGFPGETEKQFQNTVKAFKEIKFNKAYVNKYSTRPDTLAAKFKDDVPLAEKKRRWKILDDLVNRVKKQMSKIVVVLGPTASGKSDLAVKLAKKFSAQGGPQPKADEPRVQASGWNGFEIVSTDSRQVYKGMDIGTGKITPDTKNSSNFGTGQAKKKYIFTHKGIPHYMLDIVSPQKQITVAEYRKSALEAIDKIYKKGKIPILCGGTGFYIRAVVEGLKLPAVKPDWKLRKQLEKKTTEELFEELKKLDPRRAKEIDSKNRRRLIRALEINIKSGKPVPPPEFAWAHSRCRRPKAEGALFECLYIGIKKSPEELRRLINKRVNKMIKDGLEKEVKKLVKKYGWNIILKNAIGYKEWRDSNDKNLITNAIKSNTYHYAKRQMTWFKTNKEINWVKNYQQAKNLLGQFLSF